MWFELMVLERNNLRVWRGEESCIINTYNMYNRRESMRVKEIFFNKNKIGDIQGTA